MAAPGFSIASEIIHASPADPGEDAASLGRIIFIRKNKEDKVCSICLESTYGKSVEVTPCKHYFHASCLMKWKDQKRKDTCPTCRGELFPHGRPDFADAMDVDMSENDAVELLLQLGVPEMLVATIQPLPPPPFTLPNSPISFFISRTPGVGIRQLTEVVAWVRTMGVRITNVTTALDRITAGIASRRPGGMEVLVSDDSDQRNMTYIYAVAIARPTDTGGVNSDIISNIYPTDRGQPLAAVDCTGMDRAQRVQALTQAACFVIACEPSVVIRGLITGSGLGFGSREEALVNFPQTVFHNDEVRLEIQPLLSDVHDMIAQARDEEERAPDEPDSDDDEDYPDSP